MKAWFRIALEGCFNLLQQIPRVLTNERDALYLPDFKSLSNFRPYLWNHWSGCHRQLVAAGRVTAELRAAMLRVSAMLQKIPSFAISRPGVPGLCWCRLRG